MIELPWSEFKDQVLANTAWDRIYFDTNNHYIIYAKQADFTALCKIYKDSGSDQQDFEDNYKDNINQTIITKIQTRFEREDIRLLMAKAEAEFDENGEAEVTIKIPEVLIEGGGRFIGGGFSFTNGFAFGDFCSAISVVDVDNVLGQGAHTTIATYHDPDVPTDNQGWYLWPSHQGSGEIEVEPMGFYGFIVSELYLELYFKKAAGSTATKVFVDFWWGKQT